MNCPNCNAETYSTVVYFLKNGKRIEQCSRCPEKYSPQPMIDEHGIRVHGLFGKNSKRTKAHDADISRRRLSPDGKEVYRDYGKRVFA